MTFTITAAVPPVPIAHDGSSKTDSVDSDDSDGDLDMAPPSKRPKLSGKSIITPGETVTDDPQWMRYFLLSPVPISLS